MLERLVYRSNAVGEIGSLTLFDLLTQARKRNARLGITGHLIFDGEHFTQWIEGPGTSIDELWESISKDQRHTQIMLIARGFVSERRYAEWTMAFSSYPSLNSHNLPGFFPATESDISERVKDLTQ